jgi:hypothetical protein
MTDDLITALLERQVLETTAIVTARYRSIDVFGRSFERRDVFRIEKISRDNDQTIFELVTLRDGNTSISVSPDNIELIDGMDVQRYADIYDILPDGSQKKVGRKRGRKPKVLMH